MSRGQSRVFLSLFFIMALAAVEAKSDGATEERRGPPPPTPASEASTFLATPGGITAADFSALSPAARAEVIRQATSEQARTIIAGTTGEERDRLILANPELLNRLNQGDLNLLFTGASPGLTRTLQERINSIRGGQPTTAGATPAPGRANQPPQQQNQTQVNQQAKNENKAAENKNATQQTASAAGAGQSGMQGDNKGNKGDAPKAPEVPMPKAVASAPPAPPAIADVNIAALAMTVASITKGVGFNSSDVIAGAQGSRAMALGILNTGSGGLLGGTVASANAPTSGAGGSRGYGFKADRLLENVGPSGSSSLPAGYGVSSAAGSSPSARFLIDQAARDGIVAVGGGSGGSGGGAFRPYGQTYGSAVRADAVQESSVNGAVVDSSGPIVSAQGHRGK